MHVAIGIYCLVVAALMAIWWGLEIREGALSRPDRSRGEIGLHLAAELATATLLAVGGILLATGVSEAVALVGLGMLMYTVIQSPGYFLSRRELLPVVMFAVLAGFTALAIAAAAAL